MKFLRHEWARLLLTAVAIYDLVRGDLNFWTGFLVACVLMMWGMQLIDLWEARARREIKK